MLLGLIKGLIVGLVVSIPVGPLGLLCIPRTLAQGRKAGLAVGLGGTVSDTVYAALALFALSFISSFVQANEAWILLAGGAIISFSGIRLLVTRHPIRHPENVRPQAVSNARAAEGAINGFLISVTNRAHWYVCYGFSLFSKWTPGILLSCLRNGLAQHSVLLPHGH